MAIVGTGISLPDFDPPDLSPPDYAGDSLATARELNLPAFVQRTAIDHLPSAEDVDLYRIELQAGDLLVADVDRVPSSSPPQSRLSVLDANGNLLAVREGWSTEPESGQITPDPSLKFWADQTAAYFLQLETTASDYDSGRAYKLKLDRVALEDSDPDAARLDIPGESHAWLNEAGDRLIVTGPSGYGFALEAAWQKGRDGVDIHYFTGGTILIHTSALDDSVGPLPLQVPDGQEFTVTTRTPGWDELGAIQNIDGELGFSLAPIADEIADAIGWDVSNIAVSPKWTIRLGSEVKSAFPQHEVNQVLDGVPYLVYGDAGQIKAELGKAKLVVGDDDDLILVADPADPALYVGYQDFAIAASLSGLIPFNNELGPNRSSYEPFLEQFYGHVFLSVEHELELEQMEYPIPIAMSGDVTLNLDANGDGQFLGGNGNAHELLEGNFGVLDDVIGDIDVGINGRVAVAFGVGDWNLAVPMGQATALYSATHHAVWFRGAQGYAVDLWEETPLDYITGGPGVEVEGYVDGDNAFSVSLTGSQHLFGREAALTVAVTSDGTIHGTQIYAAGTVETLIGQAMVYGAVELNGDFELGGSLDVGIGGGENYIRGHADIILSKVGEQMFVDANVDARGQFVVRALDHPLARATGDVSGSLEMRIDRDGTTHYSCGLEYDVGVDVYAYDFWSRKWYWQDLMDAEGAFEVSNNKLSFSVAGHEFALPLP